VRLAHVRLAAADGAATGRDERRSLEESASS